MGTATTILAWASLIVLAIGWDAHGKFKFLLETTRPDEWDMAPVWERRGHRWHGIGLATFGGSTLVLVALIASRTVF